MNNCLGPRHGPLSNCFAPQGPYATDHRDHTMDNKATGPDHKDHATDHWETDRDHKEHATDDRDHTTVHRDHAMDYWPAGPNQKDCHGPQLNKITIN